MPADHRAGLASIKRFDQLVAYLRDEMGWPIASGDAFEDLTFEYTPEELGIDPKNAAKIQEIKRLRPLSANQPWGIFFVKFEPKRVQAGVLRSILGRVVLKKRASANSGERQAWAADDLLFISAFGAEDERRMVFAHFSQPARREDLPVLKVVDWDHLDTALHIDDVAHKLTTSLAWPDDTSAVDKWRERWRSAFDLRLRETIETSKHLSIHLAELARRIRDRIHTALAIETDTGRLTRLMKAFQEALVHDLDADGFADMYAQTIAYGLLSARIADPHKKTADDFAAHMRTNPFLRELMETFLKVGGRRGKAGEPGIDFDELGVSEVVDLLDDANMEAVVIDFGDRNPQEDPVIHFYELFLKEYDAKKRIQRGVFYTPRPVVSYIVRSVDELLRTEFGLADGLADTTTWGEMAKRHKDLKIPEGVSPDRDFVQILDPATGTGTFLVEVIDLIHRTLVAKWRGQGHAEKKIEALWNAYVPKHLLTRVHGYEILMAPYAIAHLKIGLKLYETDYRFGSDERARVYLTNALEPASNIGQQTLSGFLPALAHESQAVNEIKRKQRFTVVIGNPPYAGHSLNNQVAWIVEKVHDYKRGFPELAKPAQAKWLQDDYVKFIRLGESAIESAGSGLLGYITNHSYLDNPTFRGMRRHLQRTFGALHVLDLHGNVKKREVAPDGSPDENVFDIQQGVSILLAARPGKDGTARLLFSELKGKRDDKYLALLRSSLDRQGWLRLGGGPEFFLFRPEDSALKEEFTSFAGLPAVMSLNGDPAPGIVTTHDEFAISWSREEMVAKVATLVRTKDEEEARSHFRLCAQAQWNYRRAKVELLKGDWKRDLGLVLYRPFDLRWTVYNPHVAVHRRMRASRHFLGESNLGLCVGKAGQVVGGGDWNLVSCTRHPVDFNYFYRGGACNFPLYLLPESDELDLGHGRRINVADSFLQGVGIALAKSDAESVLGFVYSILHSSTYRRRYAEFLKIDFPRLPVTGNLVLFRALGRLGRELTALHLLESPKLAKPITEFIGGRNPEVEKVSWSKNTVWIDKAQTTGFKGAREDVWNFHIGGYQVCEKWLKDRKGRTLSKDDIAHYQKIVVALAETIRLMKEIDEVIEQHGGWPGAFQSKTPEIGTPEPALRKVAELRRPPYEQGESE